jgi:hypothetical protein
MRSLTGLNCLKIGLLTNLYYGSNSLVSQPCEISWIAELTSFDHEKTFSKGPCRGSGH